MSDPTRNGLSGSSETSALDTAAGRAPMHSGDRVPSFMLRAQAWAHGRLPNESRLVLGVVVVGLAVVVLLLLSSTRFLSVIFDALDVFAFLGLFLVNWLGNGGALVPIPGARLVGLLMIFQQAVLMPSWEVLAVAGAAMSLGLLSYYVAGARAAQAYAEGDAAGAEQLAADTGMLGAEASDVTSVSGGEGMASRTSAPPETGQPSRLGRFVSSFRTSFRKTQERAQPILEERGSMGMFLLCFAPTPMGTAAAFLGGLLRFGFARYLAASFAAKYLLAGIIVVTALLFSDAARAVDVPELDLPFLD